MNYTPDNVSLKELSFEELVNLNGQAMEEIDRIPYQPILYALPEEWLKADRALRQQAAEFQPTLYQMIRPLATAEQVAQMQDEQLRLFQAEKREMLRSVQSSLQQDGSLREKFSSEISEILSKHRADMKAAALEADRKLKKLLATTSVASVVLSVLVCVVWHLLVG